MTQLSNLPDNLTESSIPDCSDAEIAIASLTDALCEICLSDIQTCPVNGDVSRCPHNVVEKAQHEFYNGCD